jgi:hypothetical protein
MIDINQLYTLLAKKLVNTRNTLTEVCLENDIDIQDIDIDMLETFIDQCSHCNIWSTRLVADLDDNPICPICVKLTGL